MWDLFISHAHEDKAAVARPLADMLRAKGLKVWYDEFTLRIGDSIRRSIDTGLAKSRFGVVILSRSFFAKKWPQKELDGLFALESAGADRILPVWHNVRSADVSNFSPMLVSLKGISTDAGTDHVAAEIVKKVCTYQITDHHGRMQEVDVCGCDAHGSPLVPSWLATDTERMGSMWLVERLMASAELRIYRDPQWCDGTWFVVDVLDADGVVVNLDQLSELMPTSATTTTTTPPPREPK